ATIVARRFEAHVVGLHVQPLDATPAYAGIELREALKKLNRDALERAAGAAKTQFERQLAGAQLSTEWRTARGPVEDQVALHARYSDLCILGQPNPEATPALDEAALDRILLATGRPVMIVPFAGRYDTVGSRVMVAWDGSRAATRAISDAMPFLTRAETVTVLAVNPRRGIHGHGDQPCADIALHLARHGINVQAAYDVSHEISVSDVLLSRAADMAADLVVMGAYGHPRVLELVLGGVTRSLLQHMTAPVLMSH
ncbi:MAG: universal stress protein, partial [Alphaproteobacteria bacterium]|nr:universal stress protein [Alphaproteobacteria bacterium]